MAPTPPLLEMRSICKSFPGVRALSDVSFDLRAGEVHALVGENGAGKSTLLSCMNGLLQPDSGEILLEGRPVTLGSPTQAIANRLAMVHQELVLCPNLSVAHNIFLGREPTHGAGRIDRTRMNRNASDILEAIGVSIDPDRILETLSLNERQIVEICRALSIDPKVIVLDEPTASLNDDQVVHLLEVVRTLRARGLGIVYVSHRLNEVLAISDRITVLRDGCNVATGAGAEMTERKLVASMVGDERSRTEDLYRPRQLGEVVLSADRIGKTGSFSDVSLSVREGEILGIAGLLGCHRETVAQALFGATPIDTGRIAIRGRDTAFRSPKDAIRQGVAFMPADRKNEGLVMQMSVGDNCAMTTLDGLGFWGLIRRGKMRLMASQIVSLLSIRISGLSQKVALLSGGNQQKVVIGKWIARRSSIAIAEDPTRGVDVGAKAEIWNALQDLADQGLALILLTTELQEMLQVCDRIIVMNRGRITGEFARDEFSAEAITNRFFV